ncbi:MAG: hypothetical protein AB7P17_14180 [Nitrospirales bacterium]|nr:hypothetical protein [Nitrospirales bacterium]
MAQLAPVCTLVTFPVFNACAEDCRASNPPDNSPSLTLVQNDVGLLQEKLAFRSNQLNIQTVYDVTDKGKVNLPGGLVDISKPAYQGWYLQHRLHLRTELFYDQFSNFISTISSGPLPDNPSTILIGGSGHFCVQSSQRQTQGTSRG